MTTPLVSLTFDVANAALPRLDEFVMAVADIDPTWSLDFPDECTPIRDGVATSSFDTLLTAS